MSAQALTPVVRVVEVAVTRVHDQTSQELLANQLGYLSHSPISRALSKVREGKADGLLSLYNARELVVMALHHESLADALRSALAGSAFASQQGAERSLNALGQRFAAEMGEILRDLGDGALDEREADRHLLALDRITADITQVKADLIARKSTRRCP